MSVQVGCEGCGKIYTVDDRFAGKKAKCKTCGAVMTVPARAKPAAAGGAARSTSSSAGLARAASGPSQRRTPSAAAASSSARPSARKSIAVDAKPDPGDFDLSALDAIEQSGEVDHDYVAPLPVAAPRVNATAASASSRPKGTVYPGNLRAAGAVTRVGGRQTAAAADVPGSFWESLKPGPAGYVFLGVIVIGALCVASARASAYAAIGFGIVGIMFLLLAKLMMLSMAREEGFTTYLMYRFVPLYDFYYLVSRWQMAQKAVSTWLKGAAMLLLALGLLVRAGAEFAEVLGHTMGHANRQVANGGGGRPGAAGAGTPEDPDHDDLDDNPDLNLGQKIAIRRARRRQKDVEAMGLRQVEPLKFPARTEFPPLPEKGNYAGLDQYDLSLSGEFLGEPMSLVMWMPEGDHPPRSLPCIFVPPMHSGLLEGNTRMEQDERMKQLAKRGFAVVSYDASRYSLNNRPQFPGAVEEELMQSDCAVHFARNAMNFVVQRATMVDPDRLYAAGEGGAGRLVLYLASVDPRIKAVATADPVCDVVKHTGIPMAELEKEARLAGIEAFAKKTSPVNFIEALKCRVLVLTHPSPASPPVAVAKATPASDDSEDGDGDTLGAAGDNGDVAAFIAGMKKVGHPVTAQPLAPPKDRGEENRLDALFDQWGNWFNSLPKTATPTTAPTTQSKAG